MKTTIIVIAIVLVVIIAVFVVLYILGKRAQKKQDEQQEAMESASQNLSFFIIDKKKMKLKQAGLPKLVLENTPKYLRFSKVPVLKVKVGPKVMTLICDGKVFDTLLPKQEVKAKVSGIYVTEAKRVRGPVLEVTKKKKFMEKYR